MRSMPKVLNFWQPMNFEMIAFTFIIGCPRKWEGKINSHLSFGSKAKEKFLYFLLNTFEAGDENEPLYSFMSSQFSCQKVFAMIALSCLSLKATLIFKMAASDLKNYTNPDLLGKFYILGYTCIGWWMCWGVLLALMFTHMEFDHLNQKKF